MSAKEHQDKIAELQKLLVWNKEVVRKSAKEMENRISMLHLDFDTVRKEYEKNIERFTVFTPDKGREIVLKKKFQERKAKLNLSIENANKKHLALKKEIEKTKEKLAFMQTHSKMKQFLQGIESDVRHMFHQMQKQAHIDRINSLADMAVDILHENHLEADREKKKRSFFSGADASTEMHILYDGMRCPSNFLPEEATLVERLKMVSKRSLNVRDLRFVMSLMGGNIVTAKDMREELSQNPEVAAIVQNAEDDELAELVIRYRRLSLLKDVRSVRVELRKAIPPISLKTKKGMRASSRKLVQRLSAYRRKEFVNFKKALEAFKLQMKNHHEEQEEEDLGGLESFDSGMKKVKHLVQITDLHGLQVMLCSLYEKRRERFLKKYFDLWEELKENANSSSDPSPSEAKLLEGITKSSKITDLKVIEEKLQKWYSSKSSILALLIARNQKSVSRHSAIITGFLHLLGKEEDEVAKEDDIDKPNIFLRQARLNLLRNITETRTTIEKYESKLLTEKLTTLEDKQTSELSENCRTFGVAIDLTPRQSMSISNENSDEPENNLKEKVIKKFQFEKTKALLIAVGGEIEEAAERINACLKGNTTNDAPIKQNDLVANQKNQEPSSSNQTKSQNVKSIQTFSIYGVDFDVNALENEMSKRSKVDSIFSKIHEKQRELHEQILEQFIKILEAAHHLCQNRINVAIESTMNAYRAEKKKLTEEIDDAMEVDEEALAAIQNDIKKIAKYKVEEALLIGGASDMIEEDDDKTKSSHGAPELGHFLEIVDALEWLLKSHIQNEEQFYKYYEKLSTWLESGNTLNDRVCPNSVWACIERHVAFLGVLLNFVAISGRVEEDLANFKGPLNLSGVEIILSERRALMSLRGMTKLLHVDLSSCSVTDEVLASAIECLWHVKTFAVSNNNICDITYFSKLVTLTELDVSGNRNIESIEPLKGLKRIRKLNLSMCSINSLSALWKMHQLKSLKAYDNKLSCGVGNSANNDLVSLSRMTELCTLDLHSNKIEDAGPLANMRLSDSNNLRSVHMGSNALHSLSFLLSPKLASATLLGLHDLDRDNIQQPLTHVHSEWNNLVSLILEDNHIMETSAFAHIYLPKLEKLDLSGQTPPTSKVQRESSKKGKTNASVLDFSHLAKESVRMPALRILDLSSNNLQTLCNIGSANLPSLEELNLSHNLLTNVNSLAPSKALVRLNGLKILNLENNKIQKYINLRYLTTLTDLNLRSNCISKGLSTTLESLMSLVELDMTENPSLSYSESDVLWMLNECGARLSRESTERLKSMTRGRWIDDTDGKFGINDGMTGMGNQKSARCGCLK